MVTCLLLWWLQAQAEEARAPLPVTVLVQPETERTSAVRLVLRKDQPQEFLHAALQWWCQKAPVTSVSVPDASFTRELTLQVAAPVTDGVLREYEQDLRAFLPRIQSFLWQKRPSTVAASVYVTGRVVRFWRNPAAQSFTDADLEQELQLWQQLHPGVAVQIIRFYRFGALSDIVVVGQTFFDPQAEKEIARSRKEEAERRNRVEWYLRWAA